MVNLILVVVVLAIIGALSHMVGNILDDKTYWIVSDIYSGIVLALLAVILFRLRKNKI